MPETIEQLTERVLALPLDARALLADRLVESLDPIDDPLVRDLWVAEAKRRLADVESGKVRPIPGEEALAEVRNSLKRAV